MMLWDNEYLYIGARIQDPDVWSNMQGRNTPLYQENNFEFFMDPESDGLNYYELEINSLGTTWQLSLDKPYSQGGVATNPSEINGLISKVGIQGTLNKSGDVDQGWIVEIAVPWSGISQFSGKQGPPNHGNSMRVQFARSQWGFNVDGKGTYSKTGNSSSWVWAGMNGQNTVHDPSLWGTVVFERNSAGTAIPSTSVTVTGGAGNVTTNVATVLPVTSAKSTTPRTMIFNPILQLILCAI
ncbi:hypothetical protein BDR26DRAFT_859662 [Obelidium mucronatum]|nr:hypothetical protein BDR26DRAFT_859662 [Obelidium mucronatum]